MELGVDVGCAVGWAVGVRASASSARRAAAGVLGCCLLCAACSACLPAPPAPRPAAGPPPRRPRRPRPSSWSWRVPASATLMSCRWASRRISRSRSPAKVSASRSAAAAESRAASRALRALLGRRPGVGERRLGLGVGGLGQRRGRVVGVEAALQRGLGVLQRRRALEHLGDAVGLADRAERGELRRHLVRRGHRARRTPPAAARGRRRRRRRAPAPASRPRRPGAPRTARR